ncbi:MAG: GNAT family N-acetyltransferase [Smithellaceae bacterium]
MGKLSDPKSMVIRKMVPDDLDAVLRILAKWNMAPVSASREIPDPERSTIHLANTFVACDGDAVVGVASYIDLSLYIAETASLAVDPAYKGCGIGFRLQEARLEEMVRRGFHKVVSETDRPMTIDWYIRHFGYRIVGTHPKKHTFSLPDVDQWTVLELDLAKYEAQKTGAPGCQTRAAGRLSSGS